MFFVKTENSEALIKIIEKRLNTQPDTVGEQPNWKLFSSYDSILIKELRRKIAVSISKNGWISAIESKEVIDFKLLQQISEQLKTKVIAIQLSEITGCCGYSSCLSGKIIESYFSEEDENPMGTLKAYLKMNGIEHSLLSFREVLNFKNQNWVIVLRASK